MADYSFQMTAPRLQANLTAFGVIGRDTDVLRVGDEADASAITSRANKIKIQKKCSIGWRPGDDKRTYFRDAKTNKETFPFIIFILRAGSHPEVRVTLVKVTVMGLPITDERDGTQVVNLACASVEVKG